MKIINKVGNKYILQFENGYITKPILYKQFKNGQVANGQSYFEKYINMTSRMHNGLLAKIVNIKNSNNIDILFEDGALVKHKQLENFKIGCISHPDLYRTNNKHKYHGYTVQLCIKCQDNIALYKCTDKNGVTSIMPLQTLLDKEGIKRLDFSVNAAS